MSNAEKLKNELLIRDLEREIERRTNLIKEAQENVRVKINMHRDRLLFTMQPEVLDMHFEKYLETGGSLEEVFQQVCIPNENSATDALRMSAKKKKPRKKVAPSIAESISESEETDSSQNSKSSTVKRKPKAEKKLAPPSTTRSSRSRQPMSAMNSSSYNMVTPVPMASNDARVPMTPIVQMTTKNGNVHDFAELLTTDKRTKKTRMVELNLNDPQFDDFQTIPNIDSSMCERIERMYTAFAWLRKQINQTNKKECF